MDVFFEKNIGFIYDVCQVIICKTSKRESWVYSYVMDGCEERDIEQIDIALDFFGTVDPCWTMFTVPNSEKLRLLSELFVTFMQSTPNIIDSQSFIEFILDVQMLRKAICEWYFDNSDCSNYECFEQIIGRTDLDERIRLNLYEFLATPEQYVQKLMLSIQAVISKMKELYGNCSERLLEEQHKFNYLKLQQKREYFAKHSYWSQKISRCRISFSVINRYITLCDQFETNTEGWILLGLDYDSDIWPSEKSVDLCGLVRH